MLGLNYLSSYWLRNSHYQKGLAAKFYWMPPSVLITWISRSVWLLGDTFRFRVVSAGKVWPDGGGGGGGESIFRNARENR